MRQVKHMKKTDAKPSLNGYCVKTYLRLIIPSLFGIFAFFINFPLPEYQLSLFGWQFGTVNAMSTMLVTHLTNFIRAALWTGNFSAMPIIIWLFGVYCLYDIFIARFNSNWRGTKVALIFSLLKVIGFVLLCFTVLHYYFGFSPDFMFWYFSGIDFIGGSAIALFVLDRILVMVTITIPLAAAFLPFLTGYGLVDFFGVIFRRVMRPVFKLPGRAAVIAVSSLLASFVVGHMGANEEYKTGRMTRRESMLIATSLTSASIGFMLVLAMNTGIMHMWNTYLWSTFFLVLLITVITARLYPLSKIPDTYLDGVTPAPEKVYDSHLFQHALNEALTTAQSTDGMKNKFRALTKDTIGVLGVVATGATVFSAIGIVLYTYTPILTWVGYIFYPFALVAMPASEALTVGSGAALSFIELTLPSLLVSAGEWSLRARFMLAVIPCTSIIFISSWMPCIMGTGLPVKFSQLLIIWLQRMILSVLFTALLSILLFPPGAV